jgi:hypothetical protein
MQWDSALGAWDLVGGLNLVIDGSIMRMNVKLQKLPGRENNNTERASIREASSKAEQFELELFFGGTRP